MTTFDYIEDIEEYAGQAHKLLDSFGLRTSGEVFDVRVVNGQVVAASFVYYGDGIVEFDIVVSEAYRGQGIGKELVESITQEYEEVAKMFYACCVNPAMSHILEKYHDFECDADYGDTKYMIREVN